MSGHRHNSNAGTQNQGNSIGDRACVRQSKLYRTHESGNDVKCILGTSNLCWKPDEQEGAYKGHKVFDHTRPNNVSNDYPPQYESSRGANQPTYGSTEIRARSNEMKNSMNSDYVNDWSTESGRYKNDENTMVRANPNKYSNPSDYDTNYSKNSSRASMGAQRVPSTSNMGGQSLSQFQSESAAYSQPPPQQKGYGRGSGNSDGFSAAMNQPDRDPSRSGASQNYQYKNNIYGEDPTPSRQQPQQGSGRSYPSAQSAAPYASEDYGQYHAQGSQYRAQYQAPAAPDSYGAPSSYGGGGGYPGGGYGQPPQQQQRGGAYEDSAYDIPGIAADGAGNREGRSTRAW